MCRVSQGGTKSFVLVHGAHRQRTTIGRYPVISLQEARGEAKRLMAEMTLGKRRPKAISFGEALDAFVATRREKNRPKTACETERLLRVNFKTLHSKQLSDIRAHQITEITDSIVKKGKRSLAVHAFNAAHTFLRFCAQRHYIEANPTADTEKPTNNRSRERTLMDDELCTVWHAADELGGHFGAIVKLLILTGQRRGEIAALQTDYIKDDNICLPSHLTKNGRAERVNDFDTAGVGI